jgi:hypothetical protein
MRSSELDRAIDETFPRKNQAFAALSRCSHRAAAVDQRFQGRGPEVFRKRFGALLADAACCRLLHDLGGEYSLVDLKMVTVFVVKYFVSRCHQIGTKCPSKLVKKHGNH